MKFGSLFAGIGGIDLGLERAGMECAWQVEIDPFCQKVLAKHWPNVTRYADVREVGKHNLEPVDLICGGFPCQDVSLAGKRAGLDGERSTLWTEYARIICELRPRWVLAENVEGLLSSDGGRFFAEVLRDLAHSGYDAEWEMLPAAAFGSPHIRQRVWTVAHAKQIGRTEIEIFAGANPKSWAEPSGAWSDFRTVLTTDDSGKIFCVPDTGINRSFDGFPTELDERRMGACGNAVVPQVAEWIGRRILAAHDGREE